MREGNGHSRHQPIPGTGAASAAETIFALRLTTEAARRLRASRGNGRVHSAFARTVNIEFPGAGDAGWVSLHGPGPIPAPFGIECERASFASVPPGSPVLMDDGAIVIGGGLRVSFEHALIVDTSLPTPTPPPPGECLALTHYRIRDGLLPVAAAVLSGDPAPEGPLATLALPALARLHHATADGDPAGCFIAAGALLGLGPGLTPSGDDCLAGWLAGAWTASPEGRWLVKGTRLGLLRAASERTGGLSRAFLAAAAYGHASEPAHDFALAPDERRLSVLLSVGATSGADYLAGYLLARTALMPRRNHGLDLRGSSAGEAGATISS
jgi:hypothetical protein